MGTDDEGEDIWKKGSRCTDCPGIKKAVADFVPKNGWLDRGVCPGSGLRVWVRFMAVMGKGGDRSTERYGHFALRLNDRIVRGWMPTTPNPKTARPLNKTIVMVLVIHIQTVNSGSSHGSEAQNSLSIRRPNKMLIPVIIPWIEERNDELRFQI